MEEYQTYTQTEQQPAPQPQQRPAVPPKSWLWQSIVVTIVCLWPFGIPAIIFASKVESLFRAGRYEESEQASRNAKKWVSISFFGGLAILVLVFILAIVGALDSLDAYDFYY